MTGFLIDNMAPLMFGTLILFLLSGFPVAFALAANGLFFGFVGIELGLLTPALLQALPERVLGIMSDDKHKHFGGGQTETTIDLAPGQHTLQLVLGDLNHVPHDTPIMSEVITITVE